MGFLEPEVFFGTMIEVRHTADQGSYVPGSLFANTDELAPADVLDYTDALDEADIESITVHRNVFGVRLSARGYMDSSDWTMVPTIEEARKEVADLLDMGDGTDGEGRDVDERAREEVPDDAAGSLERTPVRVAFYRKCEGEDWEREPVAVFEDLAEVRGLVTCYQHVGQHGMASLDLMRSDEYEALDESDEDEDVRRLVAELESIGYVFQRSRVVWEAYEDFHTDSATCSCCDCKEERWNEARGYVND